jgi:hypothetical protein
MDRASIVDSGCQPTTGKDMPMDWIFRKSKVVVAALLACVTTPMTTAAILWRDQMAGRC